MVWTPQMGRAVAIGMVLACLAGALAYVVRTARETAEAPRPADLDPVVFHDRTDATYDWVIVVGPRETFIQRAEAAGSVDRRWYVLAEVHGGDTWCREAGNMMPPFVATIPKVIRQTVSAKTGESLGMAFFDDQVGGLKEYLRGLEARAEGGAAVKQVPEWVKGRKLIAAHMGWVEVP